MGTIMHYAPDDRRRPLAIPAGKLEIWGRLVALRWGPGVARIPAGYGVERATYGEIRARTPEGSLVIYRPRTP